jgi:hypothetical protein
VAERQRHAGGEQQQVDQRALELAGENRRQRAAPGLAERVRSEQLAAAAGFRGGKSGLGVRIEGGDRFLGAQRVPAAARGPLLRGGLGRGLLFAQALA